MITGTIPTEVAGNWRIKWLKLTNNYLSGSLPTEFSIFRNGTINKMVLFHLEDNELTGTIHTEFANFPVLAEFKVNGNQLTGTIPSELGAHTTIELFHVNDNQLTGAIPPEFGNMTALKELDLAGNSLTGTVPQELSFLMFDGALKVLNLTNNVGLSGTIPEELCALEEDDPILGNAVDFDCGIDLCGCNCTCDDASYFVLLGQNDTLLAESKMGG